MKILLLSHKFFPDIGGIETVSEMLADEFAKQGKEVRVLTWSTSENEQAHKFPYEIIRKPKLADIIRAIRWADIVFENNPSLRLSWPNLFIRKPLVVALHTWIRGIDYKVRLPQKLKFSWLKRADQVIACSNALRKETYPEAIIIGNPYNHLLFRRNSNANASKDYVFLGRLVSDKGVKLAIEAFHLLLQKNPQQTAGSTFTIIGDGDEKVNLQNQVTSLGLADRVSFTGNMKGEPLVKLLNEHKYMLIPSMWHEPFGIVALEGMACGCIPIVSNGGGLPEAVGNAGVTFQLGQAENLAERMMELKNNPDMEVNIRMAATPHLKSHEANSVAQQYLHVLRDTINRRKAGKRNTE